MEWPSTLRYCFILHLFLLVLCTEETFANRVERETSSSARGRAMGNAVINSERGPYSVFYNPANIAAKDTHTNVEVLNFQLEANDGLAGLGFGLTKYQNLSTLYPELVADKSTFVGGRFSVFPNITVRNFSFGMLYEVDQGAMVSGVDNSLLVKARDRFAPVGAVSFRLFNGIFRVGANVQWVSVGDAHKVVRAPISSSQLDYGRHIDSGSGFSKNAGVTLTLPFRYLPSFSFVARDIGGTTYSMSPLISFGEGRNVPKKEMTYDLGFGFVVYLGNRVEMKFEADYRDGLNKSETGKMRHLSYGTEIIFYDFLHLRGGRNDGFWSGGLGVSAQGTKFDFSYYQRTIEDRYRTAPENRYVFQYSWNFAK